MMSEDNSEQEEIMTQITENLYLGSLAAARNLPLLLRHKITTIVCAAAEGRPHFPQHFAYWEMTDGPLLVEHACDISDLVEALDDVWTFCAPRLTNKMLIHCVHGRTRSAAVLAYILAKQANTTIPQAYALIASKRDVLVPEPWLEALQVKLSSSSSSWSG